MIPREGVERMNSSVGTNFLSSSHVIPREGVESKYTPIVSIARSEDVIPREGVESRIEAFREPPKRAVS